MQEPSTAASAAPFNSHAACRGCAAGEFVGSGSFGHVYQGTYCSRRVAVKVMEHSADAAEDIQNEMILQMSFRSRCVVAAYKCLTHARVGGGGGSSCESTTGEEFSLYVAPLSTCNSTSRSTYGSDPNASSRNSNQVNVPEWRGFHATAASAGSSGTPPLAAAGSAPHTSSRTSGEGQLQTTKLATWLLQVSGPLQAALFGMQGGQQLARQ